MTGGAKLDLRGAVMYVAAASGAGLRLVLNNAL